MQWCAHQKIRCAGTQTWPGTCDQACQYEAMEAEVLSWALALEVQKALYQLDLLTDFK
jgi:hypothetical protein